MFALKPSFRDDLRVSGAGAVAWWRARGLRDVVNKL
jgi:hypothetical protein